MTALTAARPGWSRAEKVAAIRAVQQAHPHWTRSQVAASLGMKLCTLHGLLNDPDGSKQAARRITYRGTCVDCGAETRSDGTSRPSPRCESCAHAAAKVWTQEAVVEAIQAFAHRYGRPPTVIDWSPAHARLVASKVSRTKKGKHFAAVARYYEDGCWPSYATAVNAFGSYTAALEAAGFGPNPRSPKWTKDDLIAALREHADADSAISYSEVGVDVKAAASYHFGSWKAAMDGAGLHPRQRPRRTQDAALELLATPRTARELARLLNLKTDRYAYVVLSRLARRGLIRRTADHRYVATSAPACSLSRESPDSSFPTGGCEE